MPKEQACVGERSARNSSKNAKDKSNSAALLASRGRVDVEEEASGRASPCSSGKDSGYSDYGSDSLDDQRSNASEPRRAGGGGAGSRGRACSATPLPCSGELTPIYIIKNLVLKQPLAVQSGSEQILPGQLTWGGGAGHSSQGPAQLLFIQQPGVTSPTPLHLLKPPSRKGGERGGSKNGKGTYLPILNSYPRIAPHPKKTPEQGKACGKGGVNEGQSLSKRVCMEERREVVSTTTQIHKQHHHRKQQEGRPHSLSCASASNFPHPQPQPRPHHAHKPLDSCAVGSPSVSSSEAPAPSPRLATPTSSSSSSSHNPAPAPAPAPGSSARQQRFLNTVEILSQSGLLDITLRTQELLRQTAATERDIAQLRHHARLLCQAAQAGLHAPTAWDKLLQAMAESGHYPSLGCLALEAGAGTGAGPRSEEEETAATASSNSAVNSNGSPIGAVTLINCDNDATPPSPLLAPTPDPPLDYLEEVLLVTPSHVLAPTSARDHRAKSPSDIIMPPDSSTKGSLL